MINIFRIKYLSFRSEARNLDIRNLKRLRFLTSITGHAPGFESGFGMTRNNIFYRKE